MVKRFVLDTCQAALKEHTDISFTYEPYARSGRGGRINTLRFNIQKNPDYLDRLNLAAFLDIEETRAEAREPEPLATRDISQLGYIQEPVTDKDRAAIWDAAGGDEQLIDDLYALAKRQGRVENLTGWMLAMIKKAKTGEISKPVTVEKKNPFINFNQRKNNYAEWERFELQQLIADDNRGGIDDLD